MASAQSKGAGEGSIANRVTAGLTVAAAGEKTTLFSLSNGWCMSMTHPSRESLILHFPSVLSSQNCISTTIKINSINTLLVHTGWASLLLAPGAAHAEALPALEQYVALLRGIEELGPAGIGAFAVLVTAGEMIPLFPTQVRLSVQSLAAVALGIEAARSRLTFAAR